MRREWLRRFLLPGAAEQEREFRHEIRALSHNGLIAIAIIEITVAIFLLLARFSLLPNAYTFRLRLAQGVTIIAIGLLTFIASQVKPWFRQSRAMATMSGLSTTIALTWFALRMAAKDPTADDFIPGQLTLIMLVGVVAVPLRPMQMLLLGGVIEAWYVLAASSAQRLYHAGIGPDPLTVVFIVMLTGLSVGLTALLYQQRYRNYLAYQQGRQAEVQTLLMENAASVGRLAAAVSHELNSPLGAMLSSVDTLLLLAAKQATSKPEEQQRLVRVQSELRKSIQASADRLKQLVERMQRFTNLDQAEVQTADINGLISDVAALLDPVAKESAQLDLELTPVPRIVCRPQQISAVLSNLITNAVQSVNGDGLVRVGTSQRDAMVEVQIQDNGRGMEARDLANVFDPGFKVDQGRVRAGNWSLFSSRQIVREHGGEISIQSSKDKGTRVTMLLPCEGCSKGLELES